MWRTASDRIFFPNRENISASKWGSWLKDERPTSNIEHRTSNNDVARLRNLISFTWLYVKPNLVKFSFPPLAGRIEGGDKIDIIPSTRSFYITRFIHFQKSNIKPWMTIFVCHLFPFKIRRWAFDVRCSFFFVPPEQKQLSAYEVRCTYLFYY